MNFFKPDVLTQAHQVEGRETGKRPKFEHQFERQSNEHQKTYEDPSIIINHHQLSAIISNHHQSIGKGLGISR